MTQLRRLKWSNLNWNHWHIRSVDCYYGQNFIFKKATILILLIYTERISLEQVLRDINPQRNRMASADPHANHHHQPPSMLRKTSSQENLSTMSNSSFTNSSSRKNSTGGASKSNKKSITTPAGTKPVVGNNQQNFNPYKATYLSENTNLDKNLVKHEEFFDNSINNVYVSDFKEMLQENQKNIQDINKEALKEFESLVSNQMNIDNNKVKYVEQNDLIFFGKQQENNKSKSAKSKKYFYC